MSSVYSEEEYKKLVKENTVPEIYLKNTEVYKGDMRLSAWNIPMTEESRIILIQKINNIFEEYLSNNKVKKLSKARPKILLEHTFVYDDNMRLSAFKIPMTEESRVILIQKINDIFYEYFATHTK